MESTIDHIEGKYRSAYNYLRALGLSDSELQRIVEYLTRPGLLLPSTAATAACEKS